MWFDETEQTSPNHSPSNILARGASILLELSDRVNILFSRQNCDSGEIPIIKAKLFRVSATIT